MYLIHDKHAMRKHYVAALRRSARTGVLTAADRRSVGYVRVRQGDDVVFW